MWLLATLVLAWLSSTALRPDVAAAAGSATTAETEYRLAATASASTQRQRVTSRLATSVRGLRRSAELSVREPANPFYRIGFTTNVALLRALIREARAIGGVAREANLAQLVVERETRRVRAAWERIDKKAQFAALVRQLDSLARDAARSSGARTAAEVNAFKRAHLADVRHAGRRWLVDRQLGRQGAVFISRGVRNPRLRSAIEQLYRYGAKTGDGGTADKLLSEVKAGCRRVDCAHFIKAAERRTNLLRILSEERLSTTERKIAGDLVGALTKSIRAAGGK